MNESERSDGLLSIYCALRLLCASAALGLQVDHIDVLLQGARPPERHALVVRLAADVVRTMSPFRAKRPLGRPLLLSALNTGITMCHTICMAPHQASLLCA